MQSIKIQITLWKHFSLFFDRTRNTAWLGFYLRHLKQMPGAVWCETGPKKRSEEGGPHFSLFVAWNPLIQQQRELLTLLPLVPFPSGTARLHWPGVMGLTMEISSEQDGWRLNQTENEFPHFGEEMSEQLKISHDPWVNFLFVCFSNRNKAVKSTAVWCMSVELLSKDSRAFSQCTSELSGVRANQKDTSVIQAHLTDTVLGIILLTQSQDWGLNPCSGESIIIATNYPRG